MYINLGCSDLFVSGKKWNNFDLVSNHKDVIQSNFLQGINVDSNSAELVYSSHLLEHLPIDFAIEFLKENHRVLKPGGIIRIVVPDLEEIIDLYLEHRGKLQTSSTTNSHYEWILIELFDQLSRNCSGGQMGNVLKNKNSVHHAFAVERMGNATLELKNMTHPIQSTFKEKVIQKLKNIHHKLIKLILKKEQFEALNIGQFRLSGECHQWMYDRHYLSYLLTNVGFTDIKIQNSQTSYIKEWSTYYLDHNSKGEAYKPGSLYIEAVKAI